MQALLDVVDIPINQVMSRAHTTPAPALTDDS